MVGPNSMPDFLLHISVFIYLFFCNCKLSFKTCIVCSISKFVDSNYCLQPLNWYSRLRTRLQKKTHQFLKIQTWKKILLIRLNLLKAVSLPNTCGEPSMPFVLGDVAFSPNENVMKQYSLRNITTSKKSFNYRLFGSRCLVNARLDLSIING